MLFRSRAVAGGHLAISGSANVTLENSTLINGYAISKGGAIFNGSNSSTVHITSSVITGNEAGDYGGGVVNNGAMTIAGTKLYGNVATNGGADIGNIGWMALEDSLDTLVELFKDDNIIPKGWVNDYDFEVGIFIPDVDPSAPNSLLKLDYEILPTEVVLDESSLGTADDEKITGLETGKLYKVTVDETTSYVKSDGTLTMVESEFGILTGTEIVGLTNGKTYKVEVYIPPVEEEPVEEPTPDPTPEPIPDPTPTPTPTPDPEPVTPPTTPPSSNHSSGGSSHSSYTPTVTPTVPVVVKTPVVLSSGKAVLDTTKIGRASCRERV